MNWTELRCRNLRGQLCVTSLLFATSLISLPYWTDYLYSLVSGAAVSTNVERDVVGAKTSGEEAKEAFIRDYWMTDSKTIFFKPIKR